MGNKTVGGIRVFQGSYSQHGPDSEEGLHVQKAESLQQVCCGSPNAEWPHFSHVLDRACFCLPQFLSGWSKNQIVVLEGVQGVKKCLKGYPDLKAGMERLSSCTP